MKWKTLYPPRIRRFHRDGSSTTKNPPSSGHFFDPNLRSSEVCVRIRPLSSDEAVWVGNIPMGGLLLECCLGEVMTFSYEKDVVAMMEMVAGLC